MVVTVSTSIGPSRALLNLPTQVHGFPHVLVLQVANAFYKL